MNCSGLHSLILIGRRLPSPSLTGALYGVLCTGGDMIVVIIRYGCRYVLELHMRSTDITVIAIRTYARAVGHARACRSLCLEVSLKERRHRRRHQDHDAEDACLPIIVHLSKPRLQEGDVVCTHHLMDSYSAQKTIYTHLFIVHSSYRSSVIRHPSSE